MKRTYILLFLGIPAYIHAMQTPPPTKHGKLPRSNEDIDFIASQKNCEYETWMKRMEALRLQELLMLKQQMPTQPMGYHPTTRPVTKSGPNLHHFHYQGSGAH